MWLCSNCYNMLFTNPSRNLRVPTLDPTGPTKLAKPQCTFFPISSQCCKRLENLKFLHEMDHFWLSIVQPVEMHWETVDYPKFNGWTMGRNQRNIEKYWLVVWNLFFSISYMGCHPSHWRPPSFFQDGYIKPPTSSYHSISFQLTFHIQP